MTASPALDWQSYLPTEYIIRDFVIREDGQREKRNTDNGLRITLGHKLCAIYLSNFKFLS